VQFYFDESGDYAFPDDRFDCYVQAALICPDSLAEAIEGFVSDRTVAWGLDELHAVDLEPAQLHEVAQFVGECECQLVAHLTDTTILNAAQIGEFRLKQAAKYERSLDRYRRECAAIGVDPDPAVERFTHQVIKRAGLASQITHGEFVQAHYMIELIIAAVQKSLYSYHEDRWREDFHDFHFVLDGKLPQKMAAGEKYLDRTILPALGSRSKTQALGLADSWKGEPPHPFVAKFELAEGSIRGERVQGAIDLRLIFEHGLNFEDSAAHAGLQLVDAVAHIVRRAVLEPEDQSVQAAYDAFRLRMLNEQGHCLTIASPVASSVPRSALDRYRPLYNARRRQ